ncbi:MAG: VanZ family protein [Halioglobus sp.]|nr:VanZ family protein [Halioglobus sp.]
MKIRVRSTLIFVSYAMLVAFVSLRQGSGSFIGSYDKSAHFLTYSLFAILAYRLFLSASQYRYLCLGIIVYSGLLEIAQSFVPGRDMSALDLLANVLGVILGALLCEKVIGTSSMLSTTDE